MLSFDRRLGSRRLLGWSRRLNPPPPRTPDAPIDTLFLDAGGVLLFPNWERVSEALNRHGIAISPDALLRAEPAIKFAIDATAQAESTSDADRGGRYFEGILDSAGVPRSPSRTAALSEIYAYHMEHNLWEHAPPDVQPALQHLRSLGMKLAVVSNGNGVVTRVFERTGLFRYFDAICDSFVEGVEKPNPRLFALALERTGSRAETTIHVGDLYYVDVVGARRAGLRALLMDPHELYGSFEVDRVRSLTELVGRVGAAVRPGPGSTDTPGRG